MITKKMSETRPVTSSENRTITPKEAHQNITRLDGQKKAELSAKQTHCATSVTKKAI